MSLQHALSRLRSNEGRSEEDNQYQTRSQIKQTVPVNRVFSLEEEAGDDIFDIDSDIFSSVDAVFPSSLADGKEAVQLEGHEGALSSITEERGRSIANEAHAKKAPHSTDISRPMRTPSHSPSPSPNSVERLISFTFTKTPNQKHRDSGDRGRSAGFRPPTKRINLSTSPPCSPTDDAYNEHSLLDQSLLAAFASQPNDDRKRSTSRFVHVDPHVSKASHTQTSYNQTSSSQTSYSQASYSQTRCNQSNCRDAVKPPFKIPKSHPQTNTSVSLNTAASSPFPFAALSKAHTLSTTASTPYHTPATTTLTHTPCSVSTLPSTTTSLAQISLFGPPSTVHPPFNCPSTRVGSSSAPSPLPPPSPFSTPQRVTSTSTSCVVKRKFPGPAGVLPVLGPGQNMEGIVVSTPSLPTPSSTPQLKTLLHLTSKFHTTCSQPVAPDASGNEGEFTEGPWIDMLQDLDMNDVYSAPLLKYSIDRAIKQASQQRLKNGKVTHLRVLLKSIVPACRNTSAVLKDPTGEILCTIHHSVMEDHRQELQPGAVIILRQVTVFSPAPRKHYLSITPDNIVIIYPSTTNTTTITTAQTICLTAVEKRFRDQASMKENSPQNHPQPHPVTLRPLVSSTTELVENCVRTHHQFVSAERMQSHSVWDSTHRTPSQSSVEAAPHTHLRDSRNDRDGRQPSHQQHSESIFNNQLCEDEFDSIMRDIGSGLDF